MENKWRKKTNKNTSSTNFFRLLVVFVSCVFSIIDVYWFFIGTASLVECFSKALALVVIE